MPAASHTHTVLITGSSGFTGRHLIRYLRAVSPSPRLIGFDLFAAEGLPLDEQVIGDLGQIDALAGVLAAQRPDTIVHLAGRMPPVSDAELWAANLGGTVNLLEAARGMDSPPRILVIGSAAEYGPAPAARIDERHPCRPTTTYGRTKLAQTLLCQQYAAEFGLPIMIARPFNLFGPGMAAQTVIGELCAQLARVGTTGTIRLGNLSSARDFIDVRDAVAAYWTIACASEAGEIYNVCSGQPTLIRGLVDLALGLAGGQHTVESQPHRFRAGDVDFSCGDCTKLAKRTGWSPKFELRDSLRDTLAAFREQRGHGQD